MPQPILYAAVTNHGFGHATRTASMLAEVKRICPEVVIILVTAASRPLLESYFREDFIHRPKPLDIGVVQADSLTMDKPATLEKLKQIRDQEATTIAGEVAFIRQNRVQLVIGDIPPLAASIARAANIPCWMVSNFGWDFIYRDWGGEFVEMADWIGERFSWCDRLYRLPFHEAMSAFPNIIDIGLTGGAPLYSPDEMRQRFKITAPVERTALLTFGGLGLNQVPYHNLERFPDWQFINFDQQAPELPNIVKITDRRVRPVDFMPLCSQVVSKPGYSTFAEACRMNVPVVTIPRDDFAEGPVLTEGIRKYNRHRVLTPTEFFEGDWNFLQEPPYPPEQPEPLPKDGNEVVARAIVEYLHSD
ncbi:glycosyl transferase [Egbenema bharatensis]|uniref:glycosyl transferase n=1 Tax=Egbenema bharatensis TaxID=3463334 RepID=UPI003A86BBD5